MFFVVLLLVCSSPGLCCFSFASNPLGFLKRCQADRDFSLARVIPTLSAFGGGTSRLQLHFSAVVLFIASHLGFHSLL